jgi:polysaccharide export outer membrane protein
MFKEWQMPRISQIAACVAILGLTGCASATSGSNVRTGSAAYSAIPAPTSADAPPEYAIGPLDTVDVNVFQEPDITTKGVVIDASGNLALPLIGRVHAAGLTATQLADEVAKQLGKNFYINPQVSVTVQNAVSQQVTVEGEVTEPGIYPLKGPTTLLDSVALAKGETNVAAQRRVMVIRVINGHRMAALFDINRIRSGDEPDPAVLGRDVIVVGHSAMKQAFEDSLRASPFIAALFYHF